MVTILEYMLVKFNKNHVFCIHHIVLVKLLNLELHQKINFVLLVDFSWGCYFKNLCLNKSNLICIKFAAAGCKQKNYFHPKIVVDFVGFRSKI